MSKKGIISRKERKVKEAQKLQSAYNKHFAVFAIIFAWNVYPIDI